MLLLKIGRFIHHFLSLTIRDQLWCFKLIVYHIHVFERGFEFFSNAVDEIATSIIYCFLWLICKYWNLCINVHCCWNLNSFDSIFLPQNLFHGRKDLKSPPHLKYKRINVSINHPNSTAHSSYGSTVISADTYVSHYSFRVTSIDPIGFTQT